MKINLNVDVHHLTRVEGHGNIKVRVAHGKLAEARWDIVETPRYFEVMLKGKHYTAAGILTARICGICSIGHCLASVRATENAFGIAIPEAAVKLRLLAKHGETLQSHLLHLFFLVAPDFLGLPSAIPLKDLNRDVFALAPRHSLPRLRVRRPGPNRPGQLRDPHDPEQRQYPLRSRSPRQAICRRRDDRRTTRTPLFHARAGIRSLHLLFGPLRTPDLPAQPDRLRRRFDRGGRRIRSA